MMALSGEHINLEIIGDVILRDVCAFAKYIMDSPRGQIHFPWGVRIHN
jgi:hypothetical protein